MSEVAISIDSQESPAAALPDLRFEPTRPRFSRADFQHTSEGHRADHPFRDVFESTGWHLAYEGVNRDFIYTTCKRTMDISVSLFSLVLLSPIMIMSAIAVKLNDRGPLLFSQIRVGDAGREFRCLKFRSMVVNAESMQSSLIEQNKHADHRTFKMSDDPRITGPGRVLRRLSIDELPQLINVLRGEMSIVGPRPPLPSEVVLYSNHDYQRLSVKPGLTCIWQVSGRSRLAFPEQVKMDLQYIRERSFWKDVAIMLKTIPAVLSGDGAS